MPAKLAMCTFATGQLIESRNYAIILFRRILSRKDSRFELIEFEKFRSDAILRSLHCKNHPHIGMCWLVTLQFREQWWHFH